MQYECSVLFTRTRKQNDFIEVSKNVARYFKNLTLNI